MLPLLMVMDVLGLQRCGATATATLVRLLLPAGLLGIVAGTLQLRPAAGQGRGRRGRRADRCSSWRSGCCSRRRADAPPPPRWLGRLAVVSGFTSFVAHAGGPPIRLLRAAAEAAAVVLSGTMAVFFAAINLAKWLPYAGWA
jgi:hypothetical protein